MKRYEIVIDTRQGEINFTCRSRDAASGISKGIVKALVEGGEEWIHAKAWVTDSDVDKELVKEIGTAIAKAAKQRQKRTKPKEVK